nr:unnamed protein product [Fasciola hepatica]
MDVLLFRMKRIVSYSVLWFFICSTSINGNGDNSLTQRINELKLNYPVLTQKWNEFIYHANINGLRDLCVEAFPVILF